MSQINAADKKDSKRNTFNYLPNNFMEMFKLVARKCSKHDRNLSYRHLFDC